MKKKETDEGELEELLLNFGVHLKRLREDRGMTQEALAYEAGLHRTAIGLYERASRSISIRNIYKIAKALGCEMRELLDFEI